VTNESDQPDATIGRTVPRRSSPITVRGHRITVRVVAQHLTIEDGYGSARRTRRYHRTRAPRRIIVIGRAGYITLDALRWCHDARTILIHLEPDGQLTTTSVPGGLDHSDLRRAQALAASNATGLAIARDVLIAKIAGHRAILNSTVDCAEDLLDGLHQQAVNATTLKRLLAIEARAADLYWRSWGPMPVRFGGRGASDVPEHWRTFGQRASLITGGPRVATNPANATLNYFYSLLEAETIVACQTVGLDPGVGIFHRDRRDRASLALDLMEAVRPTADARLYALTTDRVLRARDFTETNNGGCRIVPAYAETLTGIIDTFREQIAPIIEAASHRLIRDSHLPIPRTTPLTRANRRADQTPAVGSPIVLPNTCRDCGAPLPNRRRRLCDQCRDGRFRASGTQARHNAAQTLAALRADHRDPAHGGRAAELRGRKNAAHQAAVRAWDGEQPDPEVFRTKILPGLRERTDRDLMTATGLSQHYCSLIRLGKRVPHWRHWEALRELVGSA
jgi:CRISPR-associated endonuclease Cas1